MFRYYMLSNIVVLQVGKNSDGAPALSVRAEINREMTLRTFNSIIIATIILRLFPVLGLNKTASYDQIYLFQTRA